MKPFKSQSRFAAAGKEGKREKGESVETQGASGCDTVTFSWPLRKAAGLESGRAYVTRRDASGRA